jgi:hypothetical protein
MRTIRLLPLTLLNGMAMAEIGTTPTMELWQHRPTARHLDTSAEFELIRKSDGQPKNKKIPYYLNNTIKIPFPLYTHVDLTKNTSNYCVDVVSHQKVYIMKPLLYCFCTTNCLMYLPSSLYFSLMIHQLFVFISHPSSFHHHIPLYQKQKSTKSLIFLLHQ